MARSRTIVLTALAILVPAASADADEFVVTQTKDRAGACDDRCALREAVIAANLSAEGSQVKIPSGVYRLTISGAGENGALTGDLDLSDGGGALTLVGKGPGKTVIDGMGDDRVLHVDDDEVGPAAVTIRKLTVRNGKSVDDDGGGIFIAAGRSLTVERSSVTGNRTKGNSLDGGGIEVRGSIVLDRSTVSQNHAGDDGGGISANSPAQSVEVNSSTISANVAGSATNEGDGAGIYSPSASVALVNSTISGNRGLGPSADGGGVYATGGADSVEVTHSTIAFNQTSFDGGGFYVSGPPTFVVFHSIVARNQAGDDGNNCAGADPSEGATSLENGAGCGFTLANANPGLHPLALNGGPTRTHALAAGSEALGAGTDGFFCQPPTDQRGKPRPPDDCDLGAFERQ